VAKLGALPQTLVWDREGALHAGGEGVVAQHESGPAVTEEVDEHAG
jgi:hypothetical protein